MRTLEKNLHASVSPALLERVQQAAEDERRTLDEFVAEAIERALQRREFDDVLAFGKRHARERDLRPGDVARAVAEERQRGKERGR